MTLPPKKTILITAGAGSFLLLLIGLFFFLSKTTQTGTSSLTPGPTLLPGKSKNKVYTPPPVQTSLISFQQKSATSSAIIVDTGDKAITAVQLEIGFDPAVIRSISIVPGKFFQQAFSLLDKIDYHNGSIFYVLAIPPAGHAKQGKGEIATLYYSFNNGAFNPTIFQFLPRTKIAAEGIDDSVLKAATPESVAGPAM